MTDVEKKLTASGNWSAL